MTEGQAAFLDLRWTAPGSTSVAAYCAEVGAGKLRVLIDDQEVTTDGQNPTLPMDPACTAGSLLIPIDLGTDAAGKPIHSKTFTRIVVKTLSASSGRTLNTALATCQMTDCPAGLILTRGQTYSATANLPPISHGPHIYLSQRSPNQIIRVDDLSGNGWTELSGRSGGGDQFQSPWGVFVDAAGLIYVADGTRIIQTNIFGDSWGVLTGSADGADSFQGAEGIVVADDGTLYVSDWGTTEHRIIRTTIEGAGWTVLGGARGSGDGQFACPGQLHLGTGGEIYVPDRCNDRVVKTTMTGVPWTVLTTDGLGDSLKQPRAIWVDAGTAQLTIADEGNNRLVSSQIDGTFWTPRTLTLNAPSALALDAQGTDYVVSYHAHELLTVTTLGATSSWMGQVGGPALGQTMGVFVR
ncbi:MAG: NHL repeat-containing protein [Myxococcota bacterium]